MIETNLDRILTVTPWMKMMRCIARGSNTERAMNMIVSNQIPRMKSLIACLLDSELYYLVKVGSIAQFVGNGGSICIRLVASTAARPLCFWCPKLPDSQHHARLDKHRKEVVGPDTYMMATDIIAKLTKLDTKLYTKLTHIPIQKEGRGALDPFLYLFYSGSC